jgi:putative tryptophan/tyrosine transport system substrate-binding protein
MTTRRKTIFVLGAGTLTNALPAFAQAQPKPADKIWRVGVLTLPNRTAALDPLFSGAFPLGMRDLGYIEGKNLLIEWRFADNKIEALPGLAAELVQWKPDVLVAVAHSAALASQQATSTIPIVMTTALDPVAAGLVQSLARPGGNITGLANLSGELGPKRLEMLLAMTLASRPKASTVAVMMSNATSGNREAVHIIEAAGRTLGVNIVQVVAGSAQEIDNAFPAMRAQHASGLIVLLNPLLQQQRQQIAALAAQHRMPCMAADRIYVEAGCLMSYGTNLGGLFRHAATTVDKILKGAKPADLPVEQPTKFELFINGKTAKALGLKIPQSLLIMAEKVIE